MVAFEIYPGALSTPPIVDSSSTSFSLFSSCCFAHIRKVKCYAINWNTSSQRDELLLMKTWSKVVPTYLQIVIILYELVRILFPLFFKTTMAFQQQSEAGRDTSIATISFTHNFTPLNFVTKSLDRIKHKYIPEESCLDLTSQTTITLFPITNILTEIDSHKKREQKTFKFAENGFYLLIESRVMTPLCRYFDLYTRAAPIRTTQAR